MAEMKMSIQKIDKKLKFYRNKVKELKKIKTKEIVKAVFYYKKLGFSLRKTAKQIGVSHEYVRLILQIKETLK
jgi:hypothetical protein